MNIDPDDDTLRQDFDDWPARPDIRYRVFAITTRYFDIDDSPLWTPLLHSNDRHKARHNRRDSCLNCGKTSHPVEHCEEPFTNAHHLMNPEVGQLNDNGKAFRPWQQRMIHYRLKAYTRRVSTSSNSAPHSDPSRSSQSGSTAKGRA